MATCKNCIHERVCYALIESGLPYLDNDKLPAEAFCMAFKNKLDFVEVVRCKDCKFFHSYKDNCKDAGTYCERLYIYGVRPDGCCSYGERKEECSMY